MVETWLRDTTNDTLKDNTHKDSIPIDDFTEDATNPNHTDTETDPNTTINMNICIDTNIKDKIIQRNIDHQYHQRNGKETTNSITTQDAPNSLHDYGNRDVWIPLLLQQQRTNDNKSSCIHTHLNTDGTVFPVTMRANHGNVLQNSQRSLQDFNAMAIIVLFQGNTFNPHWVPTNATNHYYSTALETG